MVLKTFYCIFILFISVNTNAQRKTTKSLYIKKAQKLYTKNKYKSSIKLIKKAYNTKKLRKMPAKAIYLLGINYFKLESYKVSNFYFSKLLQYYYKKKHIKVLRAKKKDTLDEVEVSRIHKSIYYYLGQGYFALYKKTNLNSYAARSIKYLEICEEYDCGDNVDELIEEVQKIKEEKRKLRKYFNFYVSAGRLLLQESLQLKGSQSSGTQEVQSNNQGLCYGAGLRYGNAYKGIDFYGCAFAGTTQLRYADSNALKYKQSGVPIAGLYLEVGQYFRPLADKAKIGYSIPFIYRSGNYSDATQGSETFSIQDPQAFHTGLIINASWEFSFMELQMKQSLLGSANIFLLNGVLNF